MHYTLRLRPGGYARAAAALGWKHAAHAAREMGVAKSTLGWALRGRTPSPRLVAHMLHAVRGGETHITFGDLFEVVEDTKGAASS